jgi:hypothetical protein
MCGTKFRVRMGSPNAGRFLKELPTRTRVAALALLCALSATQVSAQPCTACPAEATATAIGVGFSILVNRGGQLIDVSGSAVGACEQLILSANLSYNRFGPGGAVGAGFAGGTGHIILPNGTVVNVTPANMATTIVGPTVSIPGVLTACTAPPGTTLVDFRDMNTLNYTLTGADIAAGSAVFTFDYTNGLSQLPNAQGQCILTVRASPQQSVQIAPLPTCAIQPANQTVTAGGNVTFTATTTGTGPFTFAWRKGCPGAGAVLSTSATLTINNVQLSDAGCYELTVTDRFGCITTCRANLTVLAPPDIEVLKEVACVLPGDTCGPFAKVATGVRDTACPAFCYRIRVSNVGTVAITSLTVTDPVLGGDLSSLFGPLPIAPGDSRTAIIKPIVHCVDTPDTVRAEGRSADGQTDVDQDSAEARVLHINVVCELSVSPQELGASGPVQVTLNVRNTGTAPLQVTSINGLPALVDCNSGAAVPVSLPISIGAGGSANITGCMQVECPAGANISVSVVAQADDQNGTLCVYDRNGTRIVDQTTCAAVVECEAGAGCTPGFWKNCTIHWQLTGYATGQRISTVFTLGGCCGSLGDVTLKRALDFDGGDGVCGAARILLRAAVAALLNASSPEVDYPLAEADVISSVNAALATCRRGPMITLARELDRANNLGCRDSNGNSLPCQRLTTP